MKYVKMLGLAAAAAMALMAFIGAGSASATVLCKTNTTLDCAGSGWDYPASTNFEATLEGGTATLEVGTTVLDTCTGSRVLGASENTGSASETVGVQVAPRITEEPKESGMFKEEKGLTWEGCTRTTNTLEEGTLEIHHVTGVSGVEGTVTAKNFRVTVATIFGSCIYGYGAEAKDLGTINAGTFKVTAEVPKISGNCPGTSAVWTAAYNITQPTPLFISEG
jgi:hypothetical protein